MSSEIIGGTVGTTLPKPDWLQTDPTKGDYIKNKPEVLQGPPGVPGADGSSMIYYNQNTSSSAGTSISVNVQGDTTLTQFSAVPKVNDLVISASGQLFRVTGVSSTKVTLRHMADLKGNAGDPGAPGATPYIGENGNWWIGGTDTGVSASSGSTNFGKEHAGKLVYIDTTGNLIPLALGAGLAIVNGALTLVTTENAGALLSWDGYVLRDSNGLYLTAKEVA